MEPDEKRLELDGFVDPEDLVRTLKTIDKKEVKAVASAPASEISEDDLEDESEQSYDEGLDDGMSVDITQVNENSIIEKKEDTRGRLAVIYLISTFLIFLLGMIIAVVDGLNRDVSIIDNLATIIPLLSGVFLGSLGFVLGYYFRKEGEE